MFLGVTFPPSSVRTWGVGKVEVEIKIETYAMYGVFTWPSSSFYCSIYGQGIKGNPYFLHEDVTLTVR